MGQVRKKPLSSSARRVANYRQRMREAGLVPKTIWVPDTKDPAFVDQLKRESRIIAASEEERSVMEWIDAMQSELDLGPIPPYRLPQNK